MNYETLDGRIRVLLHLPRWVSPVGLLIHVVVGLGGSRGRPTAVAS